MAPTVDIFGFPLPTYGLFMVAAFGLGILYTVFQVPKQEREDTVFASLFALIAGLVGAKALYLLTLLAPQYRMFRQQFTAESILLILRYGFVLYGGIIGGTLGILLYTKIYKLNSVKMLANFIPGLLIGQGIGRIGCFFNGCCYGVATPPPLGLHFESHVHSTDTFFPIQLVEAVLVFGLFFYFHKIRKQDPLLRIGKYLLAYPALRFILEFWRGDSERAFWLGLSTSQWVSLLLLVCGTFLLWRSKTKHQSLGSA